MPWQMGSSIPVSSNHWHFQVAQGVIRVDTAEEFIQAVGRLENNPEA